MSTEDLPQSITLNLQQGLLVHSMIDVMTKRGAFIAEELKPVGELYDFVKKELKIEEHLKRIQSAQKKQEESSSEAPVSAE
jgi:hypothetical protein